MVDQVSHRARIFYVDRFFPDFARLKTYILDVEKSSPFITAQSIRWRSMWTRIFGIRQSQILISSMPSCETGKRNRHWFWSKLIFCFSWEYISSYPWSYVVQPWLHLALNRNEEKMTSRPTWKWWWCKEENTVDSVLLTRGNAIREKLFVIPPARSSWIVGHDIAVF